MAGPLAQCGIQPRAEGFQQVKGNKGLYGAGKAAAVHPVCTPVLEIVLAQRQGNCHILVGGVPGGNHILQIHIGRVAALLYKGQEFVKVTLPQGINLLDSLPTAAGLNTGSWAK